MTKTTPQAYRTRAQLLEEIRKLNLEVRHARRLLASCYRIKELYKGRALERPRCYACDQFAVGARDHRPTGGTLELACANHSEAEHAPPEASR